MGNKLKPRKSWQEKLQNSKGLPKMDKNFIKEGIILGLLWFVISI